MLTPEEQEIVKARELERQVRFDLYVQMQDAALKSDWDAYYKVIDKIKDMDSKVCEHGRDYASPCLACDELEAKVHDLHLGTNSEYCSICSGTCADPCDDINCDLCKDIE